MDQRSKLLIVVVAIIAALLILSGVIFVMQKGYPGKILPGTPSPTVMPSPITIGVILQTATSTYDLADNINLIIKNNFDRPIWYTKGAYEIYTNDGFPMRGITIESKDVFQRLEARGQEIYDISFIVFNNTYDAFMDKPEPGIYRIKIGYSFEPPQENFSDFSGFSIAQSNNFEISPMVLNQEFYNSEFGFKIKYPRFIRYRSNADYTGIDDPTKSHAITFASSRFLAMRPYMWDGLSLDVGIDKNLGLSAEDWVRHQWPDASSSVPFLTSYTTNSGLIARVFEINDDEMTLISNGNFIYRFITNAGWYKTDKYKYVLDAMINSFSITERRPNFLSTDLTQWELLNDIDHSFTIRYPKYSTPSKSTADDSGAYAINFYIPVGTIPRGEEHFGIVLPSRVLDSFTVRIYDNPAPEQLLYAFIQGRWGRNIMISPTSINLYAGYQVNASSTLYFYVSRPPFIYELGGYFDPALSDDVFADEYANVYKTMLNSFEIITQ